MPQKICLVTTELDGPTRFTEQGCFYRGLAEELVSGGLEVTVLLARNRVQSGTRRQWTAELAKDGIRFELVPPVAMPTDENLDLLRTSLRCLEWLKEQRFDLIIFQNTGGPGYYPLLAKREGVFPYETIMWVVVQEPSMWRFHRREDFPDKFRDMEVEFLERSCPAFADEVFTTSAHILDWCRAQEWTLPKQSQCTPLPLGSLHDQLNSPPRKPDASAGATVNFIIKEDQELNLALVQALVGSEPPSASASPLTIRVLCSASQGFRHEIVCQLADHGAAPETSSDHIEVETFARAEELVACLRDQPGCVVFSKSCDTEDYMLLACQRLGLPVFAQGNSPLAKQFIRAGLQHCVATGPPETMASSILSAIKQPDAYKISAQPESPPFSWTKHFHAAASTKTETPPAAIAPPPFISVCMAHYNQAGYLEMAVTSLEQQTAQEFEVILVDDGSTDENVPPLLDRLEARFAGHQWKIVRQDNGGPAAARNRALKEAKGDFVLFMDSDNLAKPDEIETFRRLVPHSNADVYSAFTQMFQGDGVPKSDADTSRLWLPLGPCASVGLFHNCLGDTNFLMRRELCNRIGGFPPDHESGPVQEDRLILLKALLEGADLRVVPIMPYWYRRDRSGSRAADTFPVEHLTQMDAFAMCRADVPRSLWAALSYAIGMHENIGQGQNSTGHTVPSGENTRLTKELSRGRAENRRLIQYANEMIEAMEMMVRTRRWRIINPLRLLTGLFRGSWRSALRYNEFEKARSRFEKFAQQTDAHVDEINKPPRDDS